MCWLVSNVSSTLNTRRLIRYAAFGRMTARLSAPCVEVYRPPAAIAAKRLFEFDDCFELRSQAPFHVILVAADLRGPMAYS